MKFLVSSTVVCCLILITACSNAREFKSKYKAVQYRSNNDKGLNKHDVVELTLNKDGTYQLRCWHDTLSGNYRIEKFYLYTDNATFDGNTIKRWELRAGEMLLAEIDKTNNPDGWNLHMSSNRKKSHFY